MIAYRIAQKFRGSKFSRISRIQRHSRNYFYEIFDMCIQFSVIFYRGRQDGYVSVLQRVDVQYPGSKLPDPQGALGQEVPSRAISAANTEVALLQQAGGAKVSTRGTYLKMSSEKKAEIGKRAAEHGVLATAHYYTSRLPEPLKESSVRAC